MKRCAIYTRTATPDSYRCESQREVCLVFAERQGWAILVEQFDDGVIELEVAESDVGKVIGRQGRTARAFRALLSAAGYRSRKRYSLEILE